MMKIWGCLKAIWKGRKRMSRVEDLGRLLVVCSNPNCDELFVRRGVVVGMCGRCRSRYARV